MPSKQKQRNVKRGRPHCNDESQQHEGLPAVRVSLPIWKKALFATVTTVTVFLLLEGILALVGVRPVTYYEDPYVGFASQVPLFVEQACSDGRKERVTAGNKLRFFNPQRFADDKPAGSYRIFCLGGSTTFGRPYDDTTSFCGWLREFLPVADPSQEWELINAGGTSYASYRVAVLMEELIRYEPDLFVIYSGQNEFLERRTYDRIINTPPAVRGLGAIASHTRTYAVMKGVSDALATQFGDADDDSNALSGEVETLLDETVGPKAYHRDDELQKQVLAHYRYNLTRMVDIARSIGAEVVLVTPAVNLLDCSPFKSEYREGLSDTQRERFEEAYDRAAKCSALSQWERVLAASDEAIAIDDRYAHMHFLRGRALYELKRYDEAKTALERARDEDVCPLRALGPMPGIVAEVAADRDVPLVDFAALVEIQSDHGIPDKSMFLDHVHPTIEGHRTLALEILQELARNGVVKPTPQWDKAAIEQVTKTVENRLDRRSHGIALRNLAKVLGWAGKHQEARRLAIEAIKLAPDDAEAYFTAALAFEKVDEVDQAIACYSRATQLDPRYARAHNNLGSLLEQCGETDLAIAAYQRAIASDSEDQKAHFNLAKSLLKRGRFQEAADHFKRVIELHPQEIEARVLLAKALVRMNETRQAVPYLENAIQLAPESADLHNKLGALHVELHQYAAAAESFRRVLELEANHTGAMDNLAWLLATSPDEQLRDGSEAVRLAERVCNGNDFQNPATLDTLAAAQAANGQFEQAVATSRKALKLAESSGQSALADAIRRRLGLFLSSRPYHEQPLMR